MVQSGVVDVVVGKTVIETTGANEALGFMSMLHEMPRSWTTRAREEFEWSLIDAHVPLRGRRGAELLDLHHACFGAAHPRNEQAIY